jgi:hypothetical protein
MGCIDCHGSRDVHAGTEGDPTSGNIMSRMDQTVKITCESCHGGIDGYAETKPCLTYDGRRPPAPRTEPTTPCATSPRTRTGNYWLTSRVDGQRHYLPQTKDTVYNNNKRNPINQQPHLQRQGLLRHGPPGRHAGPTARARSRPTRTSSARASATPTGWTACPATLVDEQLHGLPPSDAVRRQPGQLLLQQHHGRAHPAEAGQRRLHVHHAGAMYLGVNSRVRSPSSRPA